MFTVKKGLIGFISFGTELHKNLFMVILGIKLLTGTI